MQYFWWLYLATRLDAIQCTFFIFALLSGITCVVGMMIFLMSHDSALWSTYGRTKDEVVADQKIFRSTVKKAAKWSLVVCICSTFMYSLTPTKKDAMFIAGGVGVIEAAKAVKGSEIAKTSVKIIENWLNKQEAAQHVAKEAVKASK